MNKRSYSGEYKADIVLEILREELHISEIVSRENISRTQLRNWKKEFSDKVALVFFQTKIIRKILTVFFCRWFISS